MTLFNYKKRRQNHSILSSTLLLLYLATSTSPTSANTTQQKQQQCERLTSLTYKQSDAPSDVSAILSLIHSKINADVTNVVGINVQWNGGEIHRRVGERVVRSSVTRLVSSSSTGHGDGSADAAAHQQQQIQTTVECFEVPFAILDVDECNESGEWAHACREPSVCVNTLGSYECVCPLLLDNGEADGVGGIGFAVPKDENGNVVANHDFWNAIRSQSRTSWEVSYASSSQSSCPEHASTYQCCDADGHSAEGARCRSNFQCPVDPCHNHSCAHNASCERTTPTSHPQYVCQCPQGTLGNGKECKRKSTVPKVKFDGKTPTEETEMLLSKGLICGCQDPVVDICSGFKCEAKHEACTVGSDNTPTCACKPGFIQHPDYGCVDEHPPVLQIRPYPGHTTTQDTSITRLTQGDKYEEHGVDIIDDNAEEYLRSLRIEYSRPLPQGCLLEMGQFQVNYAVDTPWTTPNQASAQRTVIIENVDECSIKKNVGIGKACPELVAMCDADVGAQCVDEVGSYSCKCPKGTEGDGFLPIARLRPKDGGGGYAGVLVPMNYMGGNGCRDTSKPVIEVLGPNPKKLRVAKVAGLEGDYKLREEDGEMNIKMESVRADRRSYYENEIRFMIKASAGAELCATKAKPNVRPVDCIRATDQTYKGLVDLSSKVIVGEPVPKDGFPLQWRVPYNVVDDAGNKAQTVWRDVILEEVDLNEFEQKTRASILAHRKDEVEHAVQKAVAEEKRRAAQSGAVGSKGAGGCPKCEVCNCNNKQGGNGGSSSFDCDSICEKKVAAALASVGRGDSGTCTVGSIATLSRHPWVLMALNWADELIGPDAAIMLIIGCVLPVVMYVVYRIVYAFFFGNGSDVRTYYHSIEDEERERRMAQNVTYYPSPSSSRAGQSAATPGSAPSTNGAPRPPPTASLSSQRNGMFSPQEQRRINGITPQHSQNGQTQPYTSPFRTEDGTDSIYQTKSPITPSRNTPAPPARTYNLRNHN